MKKYLIGFILGAVIFGSIGVLASNIMASSVTYNNTTVDRALDTLYTTQTTNITNLTNQISSLTEENSELQEQLENLEEEQALLKSEDVYSNLSYNNTRQTTNTATISLNKGNYVCFYAGSVATNTTTKNMRYTDTFDLPITGCNSSNILKNDFIGTGGSTAYSGSSYFNSNNYLQIFSCTVNSNNTNVSVQLSTTQNATTPWSGEIYCLQLAE